MSKDYLFFISHNSQDNQLAQQLYDMLLEAHPEWEGQIFLDCSDEKPLENKDEWFNAMMKAVEDSRHLIFITSSVEHLKEGNGWVYEEVNTFKKRKATRFRDGRAHKNVSYTGIFLCDCDFEGDLYSDLSHGSTYRSLYNAPEHLVLGKHVSLEAAKVRILEKAAAMVRGTEVDDLSLELLEAANRFRDERVASGAMLPESAIDEALLPRIKLLSELEKETACAIGVLQSEGACAEAAEEEESSLNYYTVNERLFFHQFEKLVNRSNVQLLGREGGCGKTTLLTKLYHHQLKLCAEGPNQHAIPLYVDAKSLSGDDKLILWYLAMNLLDEHPDMADEKNSEGVRKLATAFSAKRETPRYLLLIDGYNELPENSVKRFNEELRNFLPGRRYDSVRVVIAGRILNTDLPESDFVQAELLHLGRKTVEKYLHKEWGTENSLLTILRIPMYLKLFADTKTHSDIQNKADLLREYVLWQENKDDASAAKRKDIALYHILLRHLLPAIAYDMAVRRDAFVITRNDLEEAIQSATDVLYSDDYRRFYGEDYRALIKESQCKTYDSLELTDEAAHYYVRVCKLLHQDAEGNFQFIHQVYRDFFCAWYLAEEVRRSLKKEVCSTELDHKLLKGDVLEFVPDLLDEKTVRMNWQTYCWDRSCDEQSRLVRLLGLCRREGASAIVVANVLNMLRYARQSNLSGLDLSDLDLTLTKLQHCNFFQHDKQTTYTTNFSGAKINRENLFEERHHYPLRAACTNQMYTACLDESGDLKLWEKEYAPLFPVKTVTDVHYPIKQMIFSPDGSKIYALTDHEILQIPIPKESSSKAQVQVLHRTAALLRQIALDPQGTLCFSTVANSFNFKNISEPDAADRVNFYCANTVAAVNSTGTCLAFGNCIGYEGLRIFDLGEDGTWQERSFGYASLLEDFVLEMEELFRSLNRYGCFAAYNADLTQRCSFFTAIQQEFMDRTHTFEIAPEKIAERCKAHLRHRDTPLGEDEIQQLDALVEKHRQRIAVAKREQSSLLYLNGRRITGLQFHADDRTLLVCGIIDYEEKLQLSKKYSRHNDKAKANRAQQELDLGKAFHSVVATVDTQTMEACEISIYQGKVPNRAFYCGDDIVVMHNSHLRVLDNNGNCRASVKTDSNQLQRILALPWKDTFYAMNDRHIYEMDQDLRCVRSYYNGIRTERVYYFRDSYGGEYICDRKITKKEAERLFSVSGPTIFLHNGVLSQGYMGRCKELRQPSKAAKVNDLDIVILNGRLLSFRNDKKCNDFTIRHSLHICGCDFRGIHGTAAEPAYLQILYRMGAQTDPVTLPLVTDLWEAENFDPSDTAFASAQRYQGEICPRVGEITLQGDCAFPHAISTKQYIRWDWERIQNGISTRKEWEETDYSILEWINRLHYATETMIKELVRAGLIAQPVKHSNVGKRLMESLHKYYKVLLRTRFHVDGAPNHPKVVTLNAPFGTDLLRNSAGQEATDVLLLLKGGRTMLRGEREILIRDPEVQGIVKRLVVNRWFTITSCRHKEHLRDHGIDILLETDCHPSGLIPVQAYLCLGEQAFFAQEICGMNGEKPTGEFWGTLRLLCVLARYYRTVQCAERPLDCMNRQPIIVLIGDDLEQCRKLDERVQYFYPDIRKLYTYDSLLLSEDAAAGAGNYVEFVDGDARSVKLETLIN